MFRMKYDQNKKKKKVHKKYLKCLSVFEFHLLKLKSYMETGDDEYNPGKGQWN